LRVVTPRGQQQSGYAFLEQFQALDSAAAITASEASDRREKSLDQPAARVGVAAFGGDDQIPFLPPGETLLVQRRASGS
jgi:hypothetical protein